MGAKSLKNAPLPQGSGDVVWLTRKQAAARSGLTVQGVRGRVRLGMLVEYKDGAGRARYDATEVDTLARKKPVGARRPKVETAEDGNVAARVFKRLAAGEDPIAIVVAEKIPPEILDKYRAAFTAYRSQVVYSLDGSMQILIDRLAIESKRPTATEILQAFERYVSDQRNRHTQERVRLEADVKLLREQLAKSNAALEQAGNKMREQASEIAQLTELGIAAATKAKELKDQLDGRAASASSADSEKPRP